MANIKEYTSPIDKIAPSDLGFTAFETAGRRVGPAYNQIAEDYRRQGKLSAQMIGELKLLYPPKDQPGVRMRVGGGARGLRDPFNILGGDWSGRVRGGDYAARQMAGLANNLVNPGPHIIDSTSPDVPGQFVTAPTQQPNTIGFDPSVGTSISSDLGGELTINPNGSIGLTGVPARGSNLPASSLYGPGFALPQGSPYDQSPAPTGFLGTLGNAASAAYGWASDAASSAFSWMNDAFGGDSGQPTDAGM